MFRNRTVSVSNNNNNNNNNNENNLSRAGACCFFTGSPIRDTPSMTELGFLFIKSLEFEHTSSRFHSKERFWRWGVHTPQ